MALPRYQAKDIAVKPSSIAVQAQGRAVGSLLQNLEQFKGMAIESYKEETIGKAEKDFAKNVIEGGDLSLIDDNTIYAKTYNNATKNAFMADISKSARNKAVEFKAMYPKDFQGFEKAMSLYRDQMMAKGKDQSLISHGVKTFDEISSAVSSQIKAAYIADTNAKNAEGSGYIQKELQDKLTRRYIEIGGSDDLDKWDKFNGAIAEYASFLKTQEAQGLIPKGAIPAYVRIAKKEAYTEWFKSGLLKAEANGTVMKYLKNFNQLDHKGTLTVREVSTLKDSVYDSLKKQNTAHSTALKLQEDTYEAEQLTTYRDIKKTLFSDTTKSMGIIKTAYFNDTLSKTQRDELVDTLTIGESITSDSGTLLKLDAYPLSYSIDSIMKHPGLSNTDKRKYLDKINKRPKFTTGLYYKQGEEEIEGLFGFVKGTISGKLDFSNKNVLLLNEAKQELFDRVNALPIEQREKESLGIARKILGVVKRKKAEKSRARQERLDAKRGKKTDQSEAKTNYTQGMKNAN